MRALGALVGFTWGSSSWVGRVFSRPSSGVGGGSPREDCYLCALQDTLCVLSAARARVLVNRVGGPLLVFF